jgi:hypothetical protein
MASKVDFSVSSWASLRRFLESVLGFFIFPIVYLGLTAVVVRRWMPVARYGGTEEQRDLQFAAVFEVLLFYTFVASLSHGVILGWMRVKYPRLPIGRFVVQQLMTAVVSALAYLVQLRVSFIGVAGLLAPPAITMAVYTVGERVGRTRV